MAALHALGLLEEGDLRTLLAAAQSDEELEAEIESFARSAACLAFDVPQVPPPPSERRELLRQIELQPHTAPGNVHYLVWVPYALAACLMALAYFQWSQIFGLQAKIHAVQARELALRQRNDLAGLRLATLEPKDPAYSSSHVLVAWDPEREQGLVSTQNLPPAPAGHDYQLWVLDPSALAPVNAGLLTASASPRAFSTAPVRTGQPGFAVSLEPAGGRPSPTGVILFAVAPGQ